jgi:putative tricarboxylic transport membrane protein
MITLATIAFALLADRAGLVVTMIVSMTLAALGTPETRWREYLPFAVIMLAIGVSVFIYGLGMPIPILPKNFTWR